MQPLASPMDLVGDGARMSPVSASAPMHDRESDPILVRRRETMRVLFDALQELQQDGSHTNGTSTPRNKYDDNRTANGNSPEEDVQKVGAEAFELFQRYFFLFEGSRLRIEGPRRVVQLDIELRNFYTAGGSVLPLPEIPFVLNVGPAMRVGSSVHIVSSVFPLREHLAHLLQLFHDNAADLFPRRVSYQTNGVRHPIDRPSRKARKASTNLVLPAENLDLEDFPTQFQLLAKDVLTFLSRLNEFPEFVDEAVNVSFQDFGNDLKYWADCLQTYTGQFRQPAVQRYLHDLTGEIGEQIDSITSSLAHFTEVGVPVISMNQRYGATHLQNLGTLATFSSAVTATTLQFSYGMTTNTLDNAVNTFWFVSLVFSIASAVNSLLSLSWTQAKCRSPDHRVPWWVMIWIKRSPLVFLVISVASFSIGLVLFAYASQQHHLTVILTTVFTGFSSAAIIVASAWFALEWWVYAKYKGQKWLPEILDDAHMRFIKRTACISDCITLVGKAWRCYWNTAIHAVRACAKSISSHIRAPFSSSSHHKFPTRRLVDSPEPILPISRRGTDMSKFASSLDCHGLPSLGKETPGTEEALSPSTTVEEGHNWPILTGAAKSRFASLVRTAVLLRREAAERPPTTPILATPQARRRSTMDNLNGAGQLGGKPSRLALVVPRLKTLEPTQDLLVHQTPVRHMQFSPDGKFLATASWDRMCHIFNVGMPLKTYRVLAHSQGFVGQVAWSPDGMLLMTKLGRGMKIWTKDGVCRRTIDRRRNVHSVLWMAGSEAFLSVECSDVVKLDLNGNVLAEYSFDRLEVHNITIAGDGIRLFAVATLLESSSGFKSSKCRAEKRIIVYNMLKRTIESQIPVLNDVRDITMTKHGHGVLVSYENKGPPELWRMTKAQNTETMDEKESRLTLRHRFMPKVPVEFAGPSYFAGKDNSLVMCAAKAGDIYIWDRDSAVLLHHIRPVISGGDLTCVAWNHAIGDSAFMFATGTHDGGIRVWSTLSPSPRKLQPLNIDACSRPPTVPPPILEGARFTESPTSSDFPPMSSRTPGQFPMDIRR